MKLRFLALCSALWMVLTAFALPGTNLKWEITPELKQQLLLPEEAGPASIRLSRDGADLSIDVTNLIPIQWFGYHYKPDPEDDFKIKATMIGNCLQINITLKYGYMMFSSIKQPEPVIPFEDGKYPFTSFNCKLANIPEREVILSVDTEAEWGASEPELSSAISYCNTANIGPEFDVTLQLNTPSLQIREGMEWVLYNPEAEDEYKFFRMQMQQSSQLSSRHFYNLFLYTTPYFNKEESQMIASISTCGGVVQCAAADVWIPGEFWGKGMPKKQYNPYNYMATISGSSSTLFSPRVESTEQYTIQQSDGPRMCSYWNDFTNKRNTPLYTYRYVITGENGFEAEQAQNFDNTGYKAKWVAGIGPVGDDYASNLPYPQYNLPDGVVPTRLLYVRDIETNEVLWGDASKDPFYGSVDGISLDNDALKAECVNGTLSVTSSGSYRINNVAGQIVAQGKGDSSFTLPAGIYIVSNGTRSLKVLVK